MAGDGVQIAACPERLRREALGLVLRSFPPSGRNELLQTVSRLEGEPLGAFDALFAATNGDRLIAAVWAQPQPGRTVALWLPEFVGDRQSATAQRLISEATDRALTASVSLVQAMVESRQEPACKDLEASGFDRLTELLYMQWNATGSIANSVDTPHLKLVPASELSRQAWGELIFGTYAGTLDCPELDGVRGIDDVLHGYELTGAHEPELWQVLQHNDENAGALLLADHAESNQLELVYMGLLPNARGYGLGRAAVAVAQDIALTRGADAIVLAVDARNHPARNSYQLAGFSPWASRHVYIRRGEDG